MGNMISKYMITRESFEVKHHLLCVLVRNKLKKLDRYTPKGLNGVSIYLATTAFCIQKRQLTHSKHQNETEIVNILTFQANTVFKNIQTRA